MGLIKKIWEALKKTREAISFKLNLIFKGGVLNDEFYDELEAILLNSDMGANAAEYILERLREEAETQKIRTQEQIIAALKDIIAEILLDAEVPVITPPAIIMIVGVNGVGKTTVIGKLAKYYSDRKFKVMVAAADTFRAAAADQLEVWADRAKVKIVRQTEGADAGSVVFDAIQSFKAKKMDILLIDTAGRLHNKKNLMEELKKIDRIAEREYPEAQHIKLLVLDAVTGQNAITQSEVFNEAVNLDGVILTKLDGTAKGGVVLAVSQKFKLPVLFVGIGEGIDDLIEFDAREFSNSLV